MVIVLAGIGIKSCQDSALTNSLKDYANSVSTIMQQSAGGPNSTGVKLFTELKTPNDPVSMRNSITTTAYQASSQLSQAKGLSAPDQMSGAQRNIVQVLTLRSDGLKLIANNIEAALNSSNRDAINAITTAMADFYASDVIYKNYAAKQIAAQLNADQIPIGGTNGIIIPDVQFLPTLAWLDSCNVAQALGAHCVGSAGGGTGFSSNPNLPVTPGSHGHTLNSVSVQGTTLNPQATNAIPAKSPTFQLNITNSGSNPEKQVVCKVTLSGSSISGSTTIPETTAGETTTCNVPLNGSPAPGQYTVTATVERVPGETHVSNNTLTFPVTFQ